MIVAVARVFISYAREDKPVVQSLVEGLTRASHEVWWDADLGAADAFRETIEAQIERADVVVVLWSQRAKASRYVVDEAERAVSRGVLLPLLLDGSTPPLGFGTFNTLGFSGWGGNYNCDAWRRLLNEITRIAAVPMPPPARSPTQVLPQALVVTAVWGTLVGLAMWGLYPPGNPGKTSVLGHPLIDSIAIGILVAAPVALWSSIETKQAGFEKLSLIARRSLVWFAVGGGIALVIIALAAASGQLGPSSPRSMTIDLIRAFVTYTAASAFAVTTVRLGWMLVSSALGIRSR